jgi:hypothetical protein
MKRYTLRRLFQDAKVFMQLRLEYRKTNRPPAKDGSSRWLLGYVTGVRRRARLKGRQKYLVRPQLLYFGLGETRSGVNEVRHENF